LPQEIQQVLHEVQVDCGPAELKTA